MNEVNDVRSKEYHRTRSKYHEPSHSPTPSKCSINETHFKEIELILTQENCNLKEHKNYLIDEVRRCNETVKKYKRKLKEYERKIQQLENENDLYKLQYIQVKQYVFEGLHRMEHIVDKD